MRKYVGEIGLLTVAIMWGMGFVASDIALDSFTPYQVMLLRFLIAAVIMSVVFLRKVLKMDRKHLFYGAILGTILYISFILQTVGLKYTTPSKNAFLTTVNVIVVPFIGFLLYRRKIDKFGLVGAFFACVGIGCLSWQAEMVINIGDILTLICAVGYAFHIFYTGESLKRGCEPAKLTVVQMVVAFLWGLLVVIFKGEVPSLSVGLKADYYSILYLGIFSTCAAFFLQTLSQKRTTETKAAIILSMESLFGTLFSVLILKERLTTLMTIGCILILLGVIIAESKWSFFKKTKSKLGQEF